MKLRILALLLMSIAVSSRAATPKMSLQSLPEFEVESLVEGLELSVLKVSPLSDEKTLAKKLKLHLEGKLSSAEGIRIVKGEFSAKVVATTPGENNLQVIIHTRNLTGPCDYNGFQKISLNFSTDELGEILPNSIEAKVNIYQRDLNCTDKFQAFVGNYL